MTRTEKSRLPSAGGTTLSRTRRLVFRSLLSLLDVLPWPWGEELLAGLFVARAFVGVRRLRAALEWASRQPGSRGRWRLAVALCWHHGRFVGRAALLGLRHPEQFRRHLVLRGEQHLRAVVGATILLGFHLGPPNTAVALQVLGHRVRAMGAKRISRGWAREAWQPFQGPEALLWVPGDWHRGAAMYQALHVLQGGGTVSLAADGIGRPAFALPLSGGTVRISSGWLELRRRTGAQVLPVLKHLDGRTLVLTVHPPLPPCASPLEREVEVCREILQRLLDDYVRQFPEQCYSLAFPG